MKGKFLVLEGLDGIGKTTTALALEQALKKEGHDVFRTTEYDYPHSEVIRATLNSPSFHCTSLAEALLFFAARANHYANVIAPALEEGRTVLLDRYIHSTLAYQGDGVHASNVYTACINELPEPDLVLFPDMDYSNIAERMRNRGRAADRIEQRDSAYFLRVQQRFRDFISPKFHQIDASQPVAKVVEACLHSIKTHKV